MTKNVLLTGCSSGLGLALTSLYLDLGYKVYGISRNKPNISNKNFYFKAYNLVNTSKIKVELSDFILDIKNIEIVHLNAGVLGKVDTLDKLSLEEIREVNEINVYANKELLDILSKIEVKNIIATSSGAATNASKGWASYCLAKSSLNMLIDLYSKELLDTKLISLAPGVIETPMTDYIRYEIDDSVFVSAKRLKEGEIQTPKLAAKRVYDFIKKIDKFQSGSFVDIREI